MKMYLEIPEQETGTDEGGGAWCLKAEHTAPLQVMEAGARSHQLNG